jgi:NADH:ubiquinone oxidoreductase subunit 4 (subunit M)
VEWLAWLPLLLGIVVLGLFPRLVFGMSDEAVSAIPHIFGA